MSDLPLAMVGRWLNPPVPALVRDPDGRLPVDEVGKAIEVITLGGVIQGYRVVFGDGAVMTAAPNWVRLLSAPDAPPRPASVPPLPWPARLYRDLVWVWKGGAP